MSTVVKIVVADDHPLVLKGLASFLRDTPGLVIVGEADNAQLALELTRQHAPSIVLMDFSMPGDVIATIGKIASEYPQTQVIVLTAFSSLDSAVKAIDAGAMGFVLKSNPASEIIEAIETVSAGQVYVAKPYGSQVLMALRNKGREQSVRETMRLNFRERQIVSQLMQARTNREIADTLHLSEKTIKHYMSGLMVKLNARNRVEVVLAARHNADN